MYITKNFICQCLGYIKTSLQQAALTGRTSIILLFKLQFKAERLNHAEKQKSKIGFIVSCSYFIDFWPSRFLPWSCKIKLSVTCNVD